MARGTHRDVWIGCADRSPGAIKKALDERAPPPRQRLILPPAPAGQSAVGIDPGKHGGLVYLSPGGALASKMVMPLRVDESVDTVTIEAWLRRHAPSRIYLELVHSHPNDGKSRIWAFASHVGALKDAIARTGIPCQEVDPQRWQNVMLIGLPKGAKTKDSARQRCAELWPAVSLIPPKCRVAHDGLADSALLACWGLYYSGLRTGAKDRP